MATVTLHVAFTFPAVAVITAVPAFTAFTVPLADTVATLVLLDFHTTLSVVLEGATVAFNVKDLPVVIFLLVAFSVTLVAATGFLTSAFTAAVISEAILSTSACWYTVQFLLTASTAALTAATVSSV